MDYKNNLYLENLLKSLTFFKLFIHILLIDISNGFEEKFFKPHI